MKAMTLAAYGGVDELVMRNLPDPAAGRGDIKVRMAGASINPIDWKLRSGAFRSMMPLEFPAILGRDVSGHVVEVGPGVTKWKIGARVMGLVTGGYAELVVAPADAWAEVPANIDLVDASALPLVLLTGAQLIEDALAPAKGDVVLVTGAVGSVGRTAVFVARARGARVWAGVRGSQKADATRLGVEGVVALDDDAEIAKLPTLDGIADTVGGPTIEKLLAKMKPGGVLGSVVGEPPGAEARGVVVHAFFARPDAARLAALARAVADGTLVIPISRRLPLARAGEAQTFAEHHAGGKVILTGRAS